MKKTKRFVTFFTVLSLLISLFSVSFAVPLTYTKNSGITMELIAQYDSGSGKGGAEIISYAPKVKRAFVVNGAEKSVDILSMSNPKVGVTRMNRIGIADLKGVGAVDDITSVVVSPDEAYVALAVSADPKQDNGYVVFLDIDGNHLNTVNVGALPDMVTTTSEGKTVLVANEGEPNDDFSVDPEGSVSVIDVSNGVENASVTNVRFDDSVEIDKNVRKANPSQTMAQCLEPEYIAVSAQGNLAYVGLQESNAVAILDIHEKKFRKVYSLGFKDFSLPENKMDASDKDDKINIRNYPVLGMYQPDGIDILTVNGKDYIVTPNEGDSQDYEAYSEEARVADLVDSIALNADDYGGYTQAQIDALIADGLFEDEKLGRLKVTTANGKNAEGKYEALYCFGGRSFSIFDAEDFSLVYDSADDFDQITAKALPEYFNATDEEDKFDNRSDDKGSEPEDIEIGTIGQKQYAFIALERIGGIMVYDVTDPKASKFETYITTREFDEQEEIAGNVAPEGMYFVDQDKSPTGNALLLVAYEISGTVAVFEVREKQDNGSKITIVHTNDIHARVEEDKYAGMGLPKVATFINELKMQNPNTLVMDAGDTLHGQTFATLEKGKSIIEVMNAMGYDVMVPGNHDFNYGYERLLELAKMADFPTIAANVKKADGTTLFTPYVIKEVGGVKVGIFGLATPETTYKTHPKNVEGLIFVDPTVEAKAMVAELQNKVDVIVALAHLGIDKASRYTSEKVAREVDGIDVIVDGHSHSELPGGLMVNGTMIVSAGEYDKNLGVVDLMVENGQVKSVEARLITKEMAANTVENQTVKNKIESIKANQEVILSEVVGKTTVVLDGERARVRTGETNLGNLITDAMIRVSGADCAITNGGGIRASIDQGDITKGDIITVLPFGNYITTRRLTGAEIKAALEHGTAGFPDAAGSFPHVANISYTVDTTKEVGNRIVNIKIQGKNIDMSKLYVVAINDFLAAGGDGYEVFVGKEVVNDYMGLDEAVIAYIKEKGIVSPVKEGRIRVKGKEFTFQTYIVKFGDVLWKIAEEFDTTWEKLREINKLDNPDLIFPGQEIKVPVK